MKANRWIFLFLFTLLAACSDDDIIPKFSFTDPGEIVLDSQKEAQATFTFTSTYTWTATSSDEWLNVSPTSGNSGTVELTFTAITKNDTKDIRTATVTLTSGTLSEKITVQQEYANWIEVEESSYTLSAEGGDLDIYFSSNMDDSGAFSVYSDNSTWLTNRQTRSTDETIEYVIRLTAQPNLTTSIRTAHLYFIENNDELEILASATVIQKGVGTEEGDAVDKSVRALQTATEGDGISIVLMGDGFTASEIESGYYDDIMEIAYSHLFSEEPIASLQDYFNVYAVTAISAENQFGTNHNTVFSCELEGGGSTGISGDKDAVIDYAGCVEGINLLETLAVVVLNTTSYAGTTYWYSFNNNISDFAIAYCPIIYGQESDYFRRVLVHEAIGHGFAKLEDEYAYEENGTIPDSEKESTKSLQSYGWAQNVDFTDDRSEVLWSAFLNDSRYTEEDIDIYEGACTYPYGVYRPSAESMMRDNINGFNVPSRQALYDKVIQVGTGEEASYEEFVEFDLQTNISTTSVRTTLPATESKHFASPRIVDIKPL